MGASVWAIADTEDFMRPPSMVPSNPESERINRQSGICWSCCEVVEVEARQRDGEVICDWLKAKRVACCSRRSLPRAAQLDHAPSSSSSSSSIFKTDRKFVILSAWMRP